MLKWLNPFFELDQCNVLLKELGLIMYVFKAHLKSQTHYFKLAFNM